MTATVTPYIVFVRHQLLREIRATRAAADRLADTCERLGRGEADALPCDTEPRQEDQP